jgi:hypothetical protein
MAGGRGRKARLADRLQLAGMLGVLALVASVPLVDIYRTWLSARNEKAAWDGITGPACPTMDAPPLRPPGSRMRSPMIFTYGDVRISRQHGHASCAGFRESASLTDEPRVYRICQFNAPSVLTVTTARGTTIFRPGPVRRATVTVRDGVATCVLGGWFRY